MKTIGLILAGGKSSRFKGVDKSWLEWQGLPLIQHVVKQIQPQVDELIISANRTIEKYQALGFTVINDESNEQLGPLAGIFSAMNYVHQHFSNSDDISLLTTPCDMPLIPENLKTLLYHAAHKQQICVAKDSQRIQPLVALIPISLQSNLKSYLESEQRKVEQWMLDTNPYIVDLSSHSKCFININDLSDLNKLVEKIEG